MTVKQKQNLLAYLGYYVGAIDGVWGTLSKTATVAFQKDFGGLTANGTVDDATEKALKHAVAYGISKKETAPSNGDFWAGIKHFKKNEFACKCGRYCNGYPTDMKKGVVTVADRTRNYFGSPAIVSSGLRCKQHNANVGGVSNSRHLSGKAIDFCIKGKTSAQVLAYIQKQPEVRYAYAIDSQYVHMDSDIL
jgi:peptidoglycan hydrolase-like protein with peptidoglycan-binding domain